MHSLLQKSNSEREQTAIGLLRHGKTVWNEAGRIQGLHDSPLAAKGARQVQQWGAFLQTLDIDRMICSDLGRVQETAAIISDYIGDIPTETDSRLREQFWGEWEGKTFTELQQKQGQELARQVDAGWQFRPPGGESRQEVLERVLPVVQELLLRYPGEQILLISHEGVVKSLLYHLAGRAFLPTEKKLLQKRQLHLIYGNEAKLQLGPLNIFPKGLEKG